MDVLRHHRCQHTKHCQSHFALDSVNQNIQLFQLSEFCNTLDRIGVNREERTGKDLGTLAKWGATLRTIALLIDEQMAASLSIDLYAVVGWSILALYH